MESIQETISNEFQGEDIDTSWHNIAKYAIQWLEEWIIEHPTSLLESDKEVLFMRYGFAFAAYYYACTKTTDEIILSDLRADWEKIYDKLETYPEFTPGRSKLDSRSSA